MTAPLVCHARFGIQRSAFALRRRSQPGSDTPVNTSASLQVALRGRHMTGVDRRPPGMAGAECQSEKALAHKYICVTMQFHCHHKLSAMAISKTATLNLRIDPTIKEAVRIAAERDHRSIANLIEVLIRKHCEATGIPIPEQQNLFPQADDE